MPCEECYKSDSACYMPHRHHQVLNNRNAQYSLIYSFTAHPTSYIFINVHIHR